MHVSVLDWFVGLATVENNSTWPGPLWRLQAPESILANWWLRAPNSPSTSPRVWNFKIGYLEAPRTYTANEGQQYAILENLGSHLVPRNPRPDLIFD